MSFRVEEPHGASTVCRCEVPNCKRRFWHAMQKNGPGVVIVGIFPADAKRIE